MTTRTIDFSDPRAIDELLETLDDDTLRRLNAAIVEHLKSQRHARTREQIARFTIGDRVSFVDKEGLECQGTVVRLNIKTVSVVTDDDTRWTVAPSLLSLLTPHPAPVEAVDLFSEPTPGGRPQADVIAFPGGDDVPAEADWIVGICKAPGYVTGEGKPYRPDMVVAMDGSGMIRGMQVYRPDDTRNALPESLHQIIEAPATGDHVIPRRVRVADRQLAELFDQHYPQTHCVIAPTPELEALLEQMDADFSSSVDDDTWLDDSLDSEQVHRFFTAASDVYLASPWSCIPDDTRLIHVSIPSLGIHGSVLSVIGQLEQEYGFLLFESLYEYLRFTLLYKDNVDTREPDIPAHRALTFEHGSDLPPTARRTISEQGWPVANAQAYPVVRCIEDGGFLRKPLGADLEAFQCIADALVAFVENNDSLDTAWSTGNRVTTDREVSTASGTHFVSLSAPFVAPRSGTGALTILEELIALAGRHDDIAIERHQQLTGELQAAFLDSPEARGWQGKFEGYTIVMQLAFQYLDETIATLTPDGLQEIVLELFPRKVMLGPDAAATIIGSVHAFYRFLGREHQLPQAERCLALLNDDTCRLLAAHLSDPARAGIGKSFLSGAIDAGVDIHSQQDLDRYLAATQGQPEWDPHRASPTRKPGTPTDPKARKKQRKDKRKARKKNR